jgi:endoglucanase
MSALNKKLWEDYKSSFIQSDGRVIDKGQNGISHSEGQGYGMLISLMNDDKETFGRLWGWTRNNIQARKDNLFAWSWGRRPNGRWGVIDYNNATDGDVLIAYALLKASEKWGRADYKAEALKIITGIREHLAVIWNGRTFLMPAYYGFKNGDNLALNPSYFVFPAYKAFSGIDDGSFWDKVYKDSLTLTAESGFGRFGLPPDWIMLTQKNIALNAERRPLFGYEAIRVILYLLWDKNQSLPDGVKEIFRVYERSGYIPLHVDLLEDEISLKPAPAGFYAIYAQAAEKIGRKELSSRLLNEAVERAAGEKDNYYSMSLLLLAINGGRF